MKPSAASNECSQKPVATPSCATLVFSITGLGHIQSFKNKKRVATNKGTGKSFLMTRRDVKYRMEQIIRSIESQLRSECQTTGSATLMAQPRQYSIASLLRLHGLDDSWQWIPELHITVEKVEPGQEGAEITITKL